MARGRFLTGATLALEFRQPSRGKSAQANIGKGFANQRVASGATAGATSVARTAMNVSASISSRAVALGTAAPNEHRAAAEHLQGLDTRASHPPAEFPFAERLFEVRFESIGGLGAHAAGQILAGTAVLRLGYNATHFSSYGSEKKGSVVRSFVRVGPPHKPIRTSSPVESPDAIVVFHAALLRLPVTLAGLRAHGTLIYNAPAGAPSPELERLPKTARVVRIDATLIAVEEKSRPNAVLLGTLTAAFPFLQPQAVLETLAGEFAGRHPDAVAANERAFLRGAREYEILTGIGRAEGDLGVMRPGPVWGYLTAPIGGVLPNAGSTVRNDLTTSRVGWLPVLDVAKCIHCGLCNIVCADFCLVWSVSGNGKGPAQTRLLGIDYRYCKGCMRCVESCPTEAMTEQIETPGLADELRVPLFPDLS